MTSPATFELARFAAESRIDAISPEVRQQATAAVIDAIGTLLAGLDERPVQLVRAHALREYHAGRATVLGTDRQLAASGAALANGAAAHALDYDSISLTVSGFIASPVLFALLAVAEEEPCVSGRQLLEAFIVGWEAEAGIARGLGVHHYAKGWHSTSTLAHFGATIAVGRLLGLDTPRMRSAIGVAASEASGMRTMIGNMVNPFHVGKAARNGVVAARLVQSGFKGHESVLEADWGFCNVFNGAGNYDLAAMTDGLGQPFDLVDPGLVVKIYPCCGLIHSGIDGVLDLIQEHGIVDEDVRRATIAVHVLVAKTMQYPRPTSGYEAKFSTPFCIATALRERGVRLAHFSDERTRDPAMLRLMDRVDMVVHPELLDNDSFLLKEFTEVTLELTDGSTWVRRVQRIDNRGSNGRRATREELQGKFFDCASGFQHPEGAMEAFRKLSQLEQLADVRELTACLRS